MSGDSRAHFWQGLCKLDHSPKLFGFLPADMILVIEILQPASDIFSNCLHCPSRFGVNPNVTPGWRYSKLIDPFEIRGAYFPAVGPPVFESSLRSSEAIYSCLL